MKEAYRSNYHIAYIKQNNRDYMFAVGTCDKSSGDVRFV